MKYTTPEIELILFSGSALICTSPAGSNGSANPFDINYDYNEMD